MLTGIEIPITMEPYSGDVLEAVEFHGTIMVKANNNSGVSLTAELACTTTDIMGSKAVDVQSMSLDFDLLESLSGTKLGRVHMADIVPLNGYSLLPALRLSVDMFMRFSDGGSNMEAFMKSMIVQDQVMMRMVGVSSITAATAVGILKFKNVPVHASIPLTGLGSMKSVDVNSFELPGSCCHEKGIALQINANLWNPSNISLYMGDLQTVVNYDGVEIGYCTLENFTLQPGLNMFLGKGGITVDSARLNTLGNFFSKYLQKQECAVELTKSTVSGLRPHWLQNAVGTLSLSSVMPPLSNLDLIDSMKYRDGLYYPVLGTGPTKKDMEVTGTIDVHVKNPFAFQMTILESKTELSIS